MLMEHLLPGCPVLSLEHIFKLRKVVDPGEVTLFCPFIKCGDRFIDCEFNQATAVIFVDFDSTFVLGIVALQLVDFGQCVIVSPFFIYLVERWMLVDGCHHVCLVTCAFDYLFRRSS